MGDRLIHLYGCVGVDGGGPNLIAPDIWGDTYPSLFAVLAQREYNGKERLTGRLSITCEPGRVILVLCDRETGKVLFYSSTTITDALEGLEAALDAGDADWRLDKFAKGVGRLDRAKPKG